MLTIKEYIKPKSIEEAYELNLNKRNVIIGGMLWLKMQHKNVNTAIDISDLGLDKITETDNEYIIGAMVSLRDIELHTGLNKMTNGAVAESVKHIVGVQFRNSATVGGSIYSRFGFSDVSTVFMALGAKVQLYKAGIIPLDEFSNMKYERDILMNVIVPKTVNKAVYLSQRNIKTDIPVLTCAVAERDGDIYCVMGSRPMKAVLIKDEAGILKNGIDESSAEKFADYVFENTTYASNCRGSKEYREIVSKVLVKRAVLSLGEI